jgi:hypothetical protein
LRRIATVAVLIGAGCARHDVLYFDGAGQGALLVDTTDLAFTGFLGCPTEQSFVVRNIGDGPLEAVLPRTAAGGAFVLVGGGAFVLEPGQSRTVIVRFQPVDTNPVDVSLRLPAGARPVRLSGQGMDPPQCVVSATSLDFGTFAGGTTCPQRTFTLRNDGPGLLQGTVTSPCPDFLVLGGAAYTLSSGEQTTVTVQYNPRSLGDAQCTLDVGAPCFCADVACAGSATATADGLVTSDTGTTLAFDDVLADGAGGASVTLGFSVQNVGAAALMVDPAFDQAAPGFTIFGPGAVTLAPGETADYSARFDPANTFASLRSWSINILGLGGCALPVTARGVAGFDLHVKNHISSSCRSAACHDGSPGPVLDDFLAASSRCDEGNPPASLLLRKATGAVSHSGGSPWSPDSTGYRFTLRWIEQGLHP